jgi:hypothetical protein
MCPAAEAAYCLIFRYADINPQLPTVSRKSGGKRDEAHPILFETGKKTSIKC